MSDPNDPSEASPFFDDERDEESEPLEQRPSRRHSADRKRFQGCLPMLAVLAGLIVLAAVFVPKGIDQIRDRFGGPEDYPGPGSGKVLLTIEPGQSVPAMGEELAELGVVAEADAFIDAASTNPKATQIQEGIYTLKKKMKAADVVDILVDPANISQITVTIPEGKRTKDVVSLLAKGTDFSAKQYNKVLARPGSLGLPPYANGNAEGYLFPATYTITPNDTPQSILKAMVDKWRSTVEDLGLEDKARNLGMTPSEIMTVASILEFEARLPEDYAKVAQSIYNRLDIDMALQSDATVAFANGLNGEVFTTDEQRNIDSPYNTYRFKGLPPGPIGNSGEVTIEAALNPTEGDWLYWVVVDLSTGETVFSETYGEHQEAVEKLRAYCRGSDAC